MSMQRDYRAPRPYQEFEAHFSELWAEEAYTKGPSYWGRSVRADPVKCGNDISTQPWYGHHGWELDAARHEEDIHDRYLDELHKDRAVSWGQLPEEFGPPGPPHMHRRPLSSPMRAPPSGPVHRAVTQASS